MPQIVVHGGSKLIKDKSNNFDLVTAMKYQNNCLKMAKF